MTRFFELAIACRMNFGLPAGEHILRRHIADGAVQAHGVAVLHVGLHQAQCIFPRQRCAGPNALRFERFVPALQPNTVPFPGQFDSRSMRNLFSPGHLLQRQGEREGD